MSLGTWIVVGVTAAVIAAGFGYIFYKWWTTIRVPWNSFAGYRPGSQFYSQAPTDMQRLVAALHRAEAAIKKYSHWSVIDIASALNGIHVYVHAEKDWVDLWGRKVAGVQEGHAIAVGRDLAALCHEMAHLLEELLEQRIDFGHAHWENNGLLAADREYVAWLKDNAPV